MIEKDTEKEAVDAQYANVKSSMVEEQNIKLARGYSYHSGPPPPLTVGVAMPGQ